MRPFHVDIPPEAIDDLKARLTNTRWPDGFEAGWERGVPLDYVQELLRYWRDEYDWREAESKLNCHPQFITEIDGAQIHFMHATSPEPDAIPLLLTHGWPGSFVEFLNVIGPLTDPRAHGLDPRTAFHVVIPSIPGFGFSQPLNPGWEAVRIARAWSELMSRLGYKKFIAQGGDAGAVIALQLGRSDPEHVLGVHINMLLTYPPQDPAALADLDDDDRVRLDRMAKFNAELSGYMTLQMNRPQTLAYALTDSPVGQLAWIVERFKDWTDSTDAPEDAVDRDHMLTNVTLYWFTASAGSSAQLYYEGAQGMRMAASGIAPPPITVPVGVAVFRHDIFLPIRRLAERDIDTITHWTEFDRGGHFAAMERPSDFVHDVRRFVDTLAPIHERG